MRKATMIQKHEALIVTIMARGGDESITPFHRQGECATQDWRMRVVIPKPVLNGVIGHDGLLKGLEKLVV